MAKAQQREGKADATEAADRAEIVWEEFNRALDDWVLNTNRLIADGSALKKVAFDVDVPVPDRLICIRAAIQTWRVLSAVPSEARQFAAGHVPDDVNVSNLLRFSAALKGLRGQQEEARLWIAEGEQLESELKELPNPIGKPTPEFETPDKTPLNEKNNLRYNNVDMIHLDVALEVVARSLRRPVKTVRAQLGMDDGAPAHETKAPRPLWESRGETDEKLSPPEFIAKHYAAEMAAGTLHRGVIAQHDKPLVVKLASWLRSHPMPKGIDIPTLPEWNTRQLEKLSMLRASPIGREMLRLDQAAKRRTRGLVQGKPL